jgi:hypothetical protein
MGLMVDVARPSAPTAWPLCVAASALQCCGFSSRIRMLRKWTSHARVIPFPHRTQMLAIVRCEQVVQIARLVLDQLSVGVGDGYTGSRATARPGGLEP